MRAEAILGGRRLPDRTPRMPRLLLVNRHYWPDLAPTGTCLADLAEALAARGHEVEVLCGRGGYVGDLDVPAREIRRGVRVRRVPAMTLGGVGALGRLFDYAGFFVQALWRMATGAPYDLAVVLTTPPLLSVAAATARRLRGRRYVIWSMDLHPEAEVADGMLAPDGLSARVLRSLADAGYRHADRVVAIGAGMRQRLEARGVPPDRLRTLGVWSDGQRVVPMDPRESALRARLDLGDRLVVMYAGNAGRAHRFDEVLEAMRRLADDDRFAFVFVGGGAQRARIERFIDDHGLRHAAYLDYVPAEALSDALGAADIHLITLADAMAGIAVPSKLYGVLAAGRPSVFVGPSRSEVARTLTEAEAGVVIDPQEGAGADRLVEALNTLADEPELRDAMGRRARAAFEAGHDRTRQCERWAELLEARVESGEAGATVRMPQRGGGTGR